MKHSPFIAAITANLFTASIVFAQALPPQAPPAFAQPSTSAPATTPAPAASTTPTPATQRPVSTGQLAPVGPGAASATPTLAEQFAIVSVKRDTSLSAGLARTAADLSALRSEPRLSKYDLSKVILEGNANPSVKPEQTEVGISWSSVARTDMKDKREVLPRPWESRVAVPNNKPVLSEGEKINAKGDMDMLVKAIDRLFAAEDKEPQVTQEKKTAQNSGGGTASAPAAAPQRSNDQAQFQPLPAVKADEPDSYSTSNSGCPVRVDLAGMTVHMQAQTLKNGEPQGDCSDSGKTFAIEKTYASCTDTTDMTAMLAYAGFRRFYVNESGETRWLDTDCQSDTAQPFAIQEDLEACGWTVNYEGKTAQKLSLFYYMNRNNKRQEVTTCEASAKTAPITATLDKNACPVRYDLAANVAYEQGKTTWQWNDKTFSDGPCFDTGINYPIFFDGANCPPVIDYEKNKVWKTSRAAYTKDGETIYIDATCGIKQTDAADLIKKNDECFGTYVDNFPGQVTYGTSKYGYDFGSGMVYVTGCNLDSAITHPHKLRRTGWQNNDAERYALAENEIYITVGTTDIVRQPATVVAGTPQSPYIFKEQATRVDNTVTPTYVGGCNKYTQTAVFDIYTRPDGTEYEHKVGPGSPVGPIDVCVNHQIGNKSARSAARMLWTDENGNGQCAVRTTHYNIMARKNNETGQTVSTYCAAASTTEQNYFTASEPSIVPYCGGQWTPIPHTCP